MNAPRRPFQFRPAKSFVVAFASALIAIGLVGSVTMMFQSRGQPWGELAAVTAACERSVPPAERQACVDRQVAAARGTQVAKQ